MEAEGYGAQTSRPIRPKHSIMYFSASSLCLINERFALNSGGLFSRSLLSAPLRLHGGAPRSN